MKQSILKIVTLTLLSVSQWIPHSVANEKNIDDGTKGQEKIIFAGGCFWCMEPPFESLDGVKSVISGYAGGTIKNPAYKQVASGKIKHIEAVEVTCDPKKVDVNTLIDVFWKNINPMDDGGQFVDRGFQYSTAIFYFDDNQKKIAEASKLALEQSKVFPKPIVTPIRSFTTFYPAETYHQDYYKKNPLRYKYYRYGSGRDKFLDKYWGEDR